MQLCARCGDTPASVFTPQAPLCKPCHRDSEFDAMIDNAIPNEPPCPNCGQLHNGHACHPHGVLWVAA